jgi:glucose/arabinose dehydrogenase
LNHESVLAEYSVSAKDPMVVDYSSERVILSIGEPESNHNGGQLAFGPDGYLYIGVGDGGGANDEHGKSGNGQNLETLLGKILRINVNTNKGYLIPSDNPFVGRQGKDEIWAYGLRNPWKFSFDKESGMLYCADVGQDMYEEIDIIEKGGNYGWRIMEGNHCFNPSVNCETNLLKLPVAEYDHNLGTCIIGGYVYNRKGSAFEGHYIFADWTGKVFSLKKTNGKLMIETIEILGGPKKFTINSLGQDVNGEIYIMGQKGIGPEEPAFVARLVL